MAINTVETHHGSDSLLAVIFAVCGLIFNSISGTEVDSLFLISKICAIVASCLSVAVSGTVLYDKYFKKK